MTLSQKCCRGTVQTTMPHVCSHSNSYNWRHHVRSSLKDALNSSVDSWRKFFIRWRAGSNLTQEDQPQRHDPSLSVMGHARSVAVSSTCQTRCSHCDVVVLIAEWWQLIVLMSVYSQSPSVQLTPEIPVILSRRCVSTCRDWNSVWSAVGCLRPMSRTYSQLPGKPLRRLTWYYVWYWLCNVT